MKKCFCKLQYKKGNKLYCTRNPRELFLDKDLECSFTENEIKEDNIGIYISHQERGLGQCVDFEKLN